MSTQRSLSPRFFAVLGLLSLSLGAFAQSDSLYLSMVWKGGKVGLVNPAGEFVLPCEYDDIDPEIRSGLFAVNVGSLYDEETDTYHPGLWGFVTLNGQAVTEIAYDAVGAFHEGWAMVRKDYQSNWINAKGEYLLPKWGRQGGDFSEGLAPVKPDSIQQWGYLDRQGKIVIEPRFDRAGHFQEGIALVSENDQLGYLQRNGQYLVEPAYTQVQAFVGDYAVVGGFNPLYEEERQGLINRKGEWVLEMDYVEITQDHAWGGTYAVKNAANEDFPLRGLYSYEKGILTPAVFMQRGGASQEGIVLGIGQLLQTGMHENWTEEQIYAITDKFYRQVLGADKARQAQLLESDFWQALLEDSDPMNYGVMYRLGLMGKEGNWIVEPAYNELSLTSEGLLIVGKMDEYGGSMQGLMDQQGHYLIEPQYRGLNEDVPGIFAARSMAGFWGLLDQNGTELAPFQYEEITYLGEGYFHGLINYEEAGELFKPGETPLRLPDDCRLSYDSELVQGRLVVMDINYDQYGLLDTDGNWILRPEYQAIDVFRPVFVPPLK